MPTKAEFIAEIQRNLTPPELKTVKQPAIQAAVTPKSALDLEEEAYIREQKERLLRLSQQMGFKSGMEALSELTHGGNVTEELPCSYGISYHFSLGSRNGRVYVQSNKVDHVVTTSGGDPGAGWSNDVVFYKDVPSQPRVLDDMCKLEITTDVKGEVRGSLSVDQYRLIQKPVFGVPIFKFCRFYPDPDQQLHINDLSKGQEETLRFFTQAYKYLQGLQLRK